MRLETEFHRQRGVTLVAARVVNDDEHAKRVRVADQCGSVRPPMGDGGPLPGWDDGGWEGVVHAGDTKPLGYATAATPTDPPVAVAWSERAAEGDPTAAETLEALGDPRPPSDAIAPPVTTLPDGVRQYLDGVAERADDDDLTEGDRESLTALAARTGRLRTVVEE